MITWKKLIPVMFSKKNVISKIHLIFPRFSSNPCFRVFWAPSNMKNSQKIAQELIFEWAQVLSWLLQNLSQWHWTCFFGWWPGIPRYGLLCIDPKTETTWVQKRWRHSRYAHSPYADVMHSDLHACKKSMNACEDAYKNACKNDNMNHVWIQVWMHVWMWKN